MRILEQGAVCWGWGSVDMVNHLLSEDNKALMADSRQKL